ncbi:DUF5104 domain-containing protein [Ruminococcus albus]|uniref:DUF5104 domain-containing protein n=1 Tax=Ruminococcus albus (strain ATCC 27210 / DSM 20455 / JCM 14654 / NCDO 2250 / 7) TaxID=697329 RepID=E6UI35_RUMA7|nr:DUF5104 domain-containing protein [Ruminococcus albus]ADU21288.1 hypothetical protein Rumal_0750 [Ruminococcus albus 7 = DSM 20455]
MKIKIALSILTIIILCFSSCGNVYENLHSDIENQSIESNEESNYTEDNNIGNDLKTRKITHGYKRVIDEYAEKAMACFVSKDTEGLLSLFSDMSNENYSLGDEIDRAYDFLGGDIISFGEIESHTGGSTFGGGHTSRQTGTSYIYEVKTDKDEFEIFIGCVIINDDDISQVGIQNIKIKNSSFDINDPDKEENMVSIGEFLGSWYG